MLDQACFLLMDQHDLSQWHAHFIYETTSFLGWPAQSKVTSDCRCVFVGNIIIDKLFGFLRISGSCSRRLRILFDCQALQLRHNEHDIVSNHQPHDCLLNRLFGRRSKKTSKLRDTGLCTGNSPGTGEFPAQRASNAENVSIWWRHHEEKRPSVPHFKWVRA